MAKSLTNEELEILVRFFDYDLTEEELSTFQSKMDTDKNFAKEVEHYRVANTMVDNLILSNTSDQLTFPLRKEKTATNDKKKDAKVINFVKRYLIPIAAVLTLCISASLLFFKPKPNYNALIAECSTYTEAMTTDILRGEETAPVETLQAEYTLLKNSIQAYKTGKANAKEDINKLAVNSNDLNIKELASWWLANIHLKEKETEQAKIMLKKIANNPDFNSGTKAQILLGHL